MAEIARCKIPPEVEALLSRHRRDAPALEELDGYLAGARWTLVSAASDTATRAFADRMAAKPMDVITKSELLAGGIRTMRRSRADVAVLLTPDWTRQLSPQLYQMALTLAPADRRYLVDQAAGIATEVTSWQRVGWIGDLPAVAARSAWLVTRQAARLGWRRLQRRSLDTIPATGTRWPSHHPRDLVGQQRHRCGWVGQPHLRNPGRLSESRSKGWAVDRPAAPRPAEQCD